MFVVGFLSVLLCNYVYAQSCSNNNYGITCGTPNASYCEGNSLESNIIFRCRDGCAGPGNCNDNLAGAPPAGVKQAALCWQDSSAAGNAQCTIDCVNVTALNGSSIYPVTTKGCDFTRTNATAPPSSVSLNIPTATTVPPSSTTSQASQPTTTHKSGGEIGVRGMSCGTVVILGVFAFYM